MRSVHGQDAESPVIGRWLQGSCDGMDLLAVSSSGGQQ
jgi:hypothetical protein